jgi:glycosyltransferase involved in cell wall biosynthesis
MKEEGAAIFNFCWDDVLNFPGKMRGGRYDSPAAIANAVDLNLTNAPASVIKYMVHGGLAIFFPESGLPEVHRPYPMNFQYDVTFVGAKYGWRPTFIAQLQRQGLSVNCFGPGWPSGALSDAEMVRMYSRSRVNLGFSAIGYSRRLHCLKGRDFEVPMSGGLYLTQWNSDLELVFDVGREILVYENLRDCVEKIRWILKRPDEAEKIRHAGRARCLKDHTYEARWGKVLELAGILEGARDGV